MQVLLGLRRGGQRLFLGGRDDAQGLFLHLFLLGLIAGQQRLGVLAQQARLIQIVADHLRTVIQRTAHQAGHVFPQQDAHEHQKRDQHDKVRVAQAEERARGCKGRASVRH